MGYGADESGACRVLPVIDEEPESEVSSSSPEMTMVAERRKAIVSRMRELLRRAADAQSAHTKLRRSTVATAKKWKRVVGRIHQKRGACRSGHQGVPLHDDGMSSVSSISSKSSFSWDAAATESCSSAMSPSNCSPLLWPAAAFVSAQSDTTADQMVSSPATSIIRFSSGSDDDMRMAHWVTTDSD
ncbi:hypothetical protein EJB05_25508, partial [Eragrostis curvula]